MNRSILTASALVTLALAPTQAEARSRRHSSPDLGTVEVMNRTGVPLTVSVESGSTQVLSPWETARFRAVEGERTVVATYTQFGKAQTLFATEVHVRDHRSVRLDARPPSAGKVRVVNETGVMARVFDNGREVAELAPGGSRILTVALGYHDVHMIAEGITVESEHFVVNAFGSDTVVGRAPRFADLVVSNPLPFPVTVEVEDGPARRVAAYGKTTFEDVPAGRNEVTVRRLGGHFVDAEVVSVSPFHGARMRVDEPTTGLVTLESADDDMLRVTLDGRLVATMAPFQEVTLLLPRGHGFLEVRELDGSLVERTMIDVDPLREASVGFGRVERYDRGQHRPDEVSSRSCTEAGDHRSHRHAEDDHEDEREHAVARR